MDSLIAIVQNFGISRNEIYFDESMDTLISIYDSFVNKEYSNEWERLKLNYSNLKYFNELINFYYIPELTKIKIVLSKIMKKIDITTRYYIPLCTNEVVLAYLRESLKYRDPIVKMEKVIKAYSMLIILLKC